MIRRPTVVYIVLLLALAGAYYYLNHRSKTADITVTAEPSSQAQTYLFTAQGGSPSIISLESQAGKSVKIARGADNAWTVTQPIEAKADQGAAEAAASQITSMSIIDTVPNVDPKIVGLETPEYVLTVRFSTGVERKADIGVVTPTESGYYVRNPEGKVIIVSKSSVDALLGLLDNPPYLETLTPSPTLSTETSTPLPASATPEIITPSGATATP